MESDNNTEQEDNIKTEICEECGAIFKGVNAKGMLVGHMKKHTAEARRRSNNPDPDRKERIPFGTPQRKFSCPENDGFMYRVFNDEWAKEPGRIQRAMDAGYEIVKDKNSYPVGTNEDGSPIKGILMRIPQELWEEDQKLKQVMVDQVEEQIAGGTLEQQANDKRYIPDGIKIHSNHRESA